jgi:pimeloyl-ACP methyl ester carboxylesterase
LVYRTLPASGEATTFSNFAELRMGLAFVEHTSARSLGQYMTVDGTRLHYVDHGTGTPVILLHGNGSMVGDFISSGIVEQLGRGYRVVAFDRPGFGYSERPSTRKWCAVEQAKLLVRAWQLLDIERPVVVGHSWGSLVALAAALESESRIKGLVLLSGYYYPMPMPRSSSRPSPPLSVLPGMLREALMPIAWRLAAPGAVERIFAPCAVPERFRKFYSLPDALRPSQMRTVREEAAMLPEMTMHLSALYKELDLPVRLLAGSDDGIVDTNAHSVRLQRELTQSTLMVIPRCGHMVHHAAPNEVARAIVGLTQVEQTRSTCLGVSRHWLQIDGSATVH